MFQFSKRNSEHDDIYSSLKLKEDKNDEENDSLQNPLPTSDPFESIKQNYSLSKDYEVYLETEKKKHEWSKKYKSDPLEVVANKIRKAEDLNTYDLKIWVSYNFLAFPEKEQEKIKELIERQHWFWRRMQFMIPPISFGIYAIMKYQMKLRVIPAFIITGVSIIGLMKIGLMSSNKEISIYYRDLYNNYKDEVLNPKYRGLKLYNNKKAYQVDNKEFTTSNFDDLKQLVLSQMK